MNTLLGDATLAAEKLGWTPRTSFEQLVDEMVAEDLDLAEQDALLRKQGYRTRAFSE